MQGVARDILAEGLIAADMAGFDIILHVHDQIVAEIPEGSAEERRAALIAIMSRTPPWADDTLPLAADGHLSKVFRKD